MKIFIALIASFLLLAHSTLGEDKNTDPDCYRNFTQMASAYGYPSEIHTVHTQDGYILNVFRVPYGAGQSANEPRPIAFVQHGIQGSAEDFIENSHDKSIIYLLADAGFDVWVGNSRGSYYSMGHETLDNTKAQYWNFTWVEMGRYDIPAVLKYILEETGQDKVSYVGHSQGTTQLFLGLSENIEWFKQRLHSFTALGPVTRLANGKSDLLNFFAQFDWPFSLLSSLKIYDLFQRNQPSWVTVKLCQLIPLTCEMQWWIGCEEKPLTYLNQERIQVAKTHGPNGLGIKDVEHYAQVIKSKRFQYFDYGKDLNLQYYHQETPPAIALEKIQNFPVGLFVGKTDELATVEDNDWLKDILDANGSLGAYHLYEFGHISFYLAQKMSYFSEDVIPFIKSHLLETTMAQE